MNLNIQDKRILVTGASRGIGRAIAFRLLEEGAQVAITARGAELLNSSAKELKNIHKEF